MMPILRCPPAPPEPDAILIRRHADIFADAAMPPLMITPCCFDDELMLMQAPFIAAIAAMLMPMLPRRRAMQRQRERASCHTYALLRATVVRALI